MRKYVTLFDKKYAPQGLVLYRSLERFSSEQFQLDILALDAETQFALKNMQQRGDLLHARVIGLETMEPEATKLRDSRSYKEFCWTMASQFTERRQELFHYDEITYLDADVCFWYDPKLCFEEMGTKLIGIVPHRFPDFEKERLAAAGQYNVSMVVFRSGALDVLHWWAARCREWCGEQHDSRRGIGDQGYLERFIDVLEKHGGMGHELHAFKHEGIGAAPWNMQGRNFKDGPAVLHSGEKNDRVSSTQIVFYHYHEFRRDDSRPGGYKLTGYPMTQSAIDYIYAPYVRAVVRAREDLNRAGLKDA